MNHTARKLKDVPRGEFVRLYPADSAPVWIRGGFDRRTRRYSLTRFDDLNHELLRRGDFPVFVGFTF